MAYRFTFFTTLSLLLSVSLNAQAAAPKIAAVSGASAATVESGGATVWGGLAGTACSDADGTPCDSCPGTTVCGGSEPLCSCNENRIYNTLQVTISVQAQENNATFNLISKVEGGTSTITPVSRNASSITYRWSQICDVMDGGTTDCEAFTESKSVNILLAFDADSDGVIDSNEDPTTVNFRILKPTSQYNVYGSVDEGIKSFRPYPGDEKVHIEGADGENIETGSSSVFPALNYGGEAVTLRVYSSDQSITNARQGSGFEYEDIAIPEGDGNLDDNKVEGLLNGTLYFFRIALLDQAGNVVQYYPSDADADSESGGGGVCTTSPSAACVFSARPDPVYGLLKDDLSCFIATAAWGTPMGPVLDSLRQFRGRVLMRHEWGRAFVKNYYHYGPKAAWFIHDKPVLRAATRTALYPVYGFTQLTFKIGFMNALLVSLAGLFASIFALITIKRRLLARD